MTELYLFNKEEVLINIIPEDDFNNDSHVRELNSKWSFEFTTTFQYLNDLSKSNKVGFYDRYREFRLFKIIKEPEVDYLSDEVVVNCLNDCYEMSDQIIEDKRLRDGTARQALDKVLEGSSYEVGEVAELGNRTINFYDISRMEGLNNIIESYGGELDYRIEFDADFKRISHKYVDIKSRLGQDTGLRFTYDLNLESVVRKDVSESHCTVLYGRGGAIESGDGYSRKIKFTDVEWKKPTNPIDKPIGQTYIEDLDAIAKYGRIEGIYENSDIEEPGELLQATYEALQECKNPKLSYEVNAKDLASQNSDYDHLTVVLGDSVILLDEDYDLNLESRIVGFEESIKEESAEMKWIIGNVQSSFSSDNASSGQIIKPSTGDVDIEIDDDKFPDALPDVPIIEAEGLFGSVIISWTYESKSYYEYELYASKLESFNPDASNLIFRGKASSYHHQVKPSETWYYRARAINTHGRTTDFSSQVKASTLKIEDGTEYFEKAAIADALIGELRLDRGWVGQLRGNWIDAKQLSVTDGNGKRTLDIDSFGNVNLDVTSLKIKNNSVATESFVSNAKNDAINSANNNTTIALENHYTKSETDSKISVAKDEINLGVSNTYETKTNVETKVVSTLNSAKSYSDTKKTEAINVASTDATNKVNSAKTELNTAIGKKANSVDVYTKSEVYTKSQTDSAIDIAKDAINLGVSQTYETKANVESKINGIQIGGRNYYLNSASFSMNSNNTGTGTSVLRTDESDKYYRATPAIGKAVSLYKGIAKSSSFKPNGTDNYIISLMARSQKDATITLYDDAHGSTRTGTALKAGVWTRISTKPQPITASKNMILFSSVIDSYLDYKMAQLECGTISSTWVSAPEDVQASIDTKANSVDVYTKTEVYTKSQTDSQINVAKDAINLGVSQTYETKTNVASQVTSTLNSAKSYADTKKNEAISSANNTLNSTIANYYTKAQTDSAIKVAKNEINLGVSNTYETKADVATKVSNAVVEARRITDTRNTNQNPQWYMANYPKQTISEFKSANVIGIPNASTNYGALITNTPWGDASGGYPVQTFKSSDYKTYERRGTSLTNWGGWVQIENAIDSQIKANTAKQEAITSANNTLTTTIANYYTKTQTDSQINVAKNAITQSVSSTYETKTDSTTKYNTATAIAKAMNSGKIIHEDIAFRKGGNNVNLYNNAGNGNVKLERIAKPSDCPTTSTHCIKITTTGTASPGWGGFHQTIQSRANAVFIQKIVAKVPTGYQLNLASNSMGTGYTDKWLTSNKGTGKWETYIRQTICGSTGGFSNGGHVYASGGATPTASAPLVWYVASCTAIDITDTDERVSSLATRMSTAESKITDTAITNVVKQNFYTKSETDKQITSKGYQTASQVQQTVNNLQIKFSQSGGYNKVRRSKPNETSNLYGFATRSIDGTDLKHDKVYTLTVNGRTVSGAGGRYLVIFIYDNGWNFSKSISIAETVDTTKSISFTIPNTVNLNNLQVTSYHYPSGGDRTGSSKVNWYQLTEGSLELPWSPHPSEVYDGITTIDKDGVTVTSSNVNSKTKMSADGFQLIRTTDNKKMFYVNQDGSLEMSGNFTQYDTNGKISIKIANNSYGCYDWLWDGDFVGNLGAFESNRKNTSGANQRFIGIANIADYGNQLVLGVRSSPNSTNFNTYMEIDNTGVMHRDYVTFTANTGFKSNAIFRNPSNNNETGRIFGATNDHFYVACNHHNQLRLGYEKNGTYYSAMSIYRNDNTSAGCAIEYYADELHHNNVVIDGFLSVKGQKNRLVATENFGDRLLNAYETAECYFGDINEAIIGEDGEVKVELDEVFLETVNTTETYHVFLTKYGEGDCYVSERHEKYFVIKGTPNLSVGFEIKAKQRGYEKERLKMAVNTLKSHHAMPYSPCSEDEAGYTIDCETTINRA